MQIHVSQPVLTQTTLCNSKFACLSSAFSKLCKVRGHLARETLIIDCGANKLCMYKLSFGSLAICSCPTRKEIYERYAI